jgi:hypothetical protein
MALPRRLPAFVLVRPRGWGIDGALGFSASSASSAGRWLGGAGVTYTTAVACTMQRGDAEAGQASRLRATLPNPLTRAGLRCTFTGPEPLSSRALTKMTTTARHEPGTHFRPQPSGERRVPQRTQPQRQGPRTRVSAGSTSCPQFRNVC